MATVNLDVRAELGRMRKLRGAEPIERKAAEQVVEEVKATKTGIRKPRRRTPLRSSKRDWPGRIVSGILLRSYIPKPWGHTRHQVLRNGLS